MISITSQITPLSLMSPVKFEVLNPAVVRVWERKEAEPRLTKNLIVFIVTSNWVRQKRRLLYIFSFESEVKLWLPGLPKGTGNR